MFGLDVVVDLLAGAADARQITCSHQGASRLGREHVHHLGARLSQGGELDVSPLCSNGNVSMMMQGSTVHVDASSPASSEPQSPSSPS